MLHKGLMKKVHKIMWWFWNLKIREYYYFDYSITGIIKSNKGTQSWYNVIMQHLWPEKILIISKPEIFKFHFSQKNIAILSMSTIYCKIAKFHLIHNES
jgi:hypothetical protein